MADELLIDDEHLIEDPETMKILGDPLRIQILGQVSQMNAAGQLATAKVLAEALDVPQTKLYYHLNLLEKHDLLRVAETGLVSGIVEKRYQIRAQRLRMDVNIEPDQADGETEPFEMILTPLKSILDSALQNFERSLQSYQAQSPEALALDLDQAYLRQTVIHMNDDEAQRFVQQLEKLVEGSKRTPGKTRRPYYLTSIFHPGQPPNSNSEES